MYDRKGLRGRRVTGNYGDSDDNSADLRKIYALHRNALVRSLLRTRQGRKDGPVCGLLRKSRHRQARNESNGKVSAVTLDGYQIAVLFGELTRSRRCTFGPRARQHASRAHSSGNPTQHF